MLISCSPYRADKNLGAAYNEVIDRLRPDDWIALIDHDAMFTTPIWHPQIEAAIKHNPDYALFVGCTNRIGCGWMKAPGVDPNNFDMLYHRRVGRDLAAKHGSEIRDVTEWESQPSGRPLSGVLMVTSKKAWAEVLGFKHGFLTVDNNFHKRIRDADHRVGLMLGVYVFHVYRAKIDISEKEIPACHS